MSDNKMVWSEPVKKQIAASGTAYSDVLNMGSNKLNGFFSTQVELTGDGTLKIEYLVSNKSNAIADFIKPTGASDIVTAFTKTTGPGSDGKDFYQWPLAGEAIFAKHLVLKLTETSTTDAINVSIYPNAQ